MTSPQIVERAAIRIHDLADTLRGMLLTPSQADVLHEQVDYLRDTVVIATRKEEEAPVCEL